MIGRLDVAPTAAPAGPPGPASHIRRGVAASAIAAAAAALAVTGPSYAVLAAMAQDPAGWADSAGVDGAIAQVAALAAWATLVWACGGGVLVLLARLPGAAGRLAATTARAVLPTVVRRGLEAALGLSLVTGAVGGALPAAAQAPTPSPSTAAGAGPLERPFPEPSPSPVVAPAPSPPSATGVEGTSRHGGPPPAVTVAAGDCLWDIAEDYLGDQPTDRQVDRAWRRWYAANRTTVGADPGLIHPGQRLVPPRDAGIPSAPPDSGGTP